MKYNFNQVSKLLEKLFKVGYTDEKSILSIQLDDLEKIPDISPIEITIIIGLKKAIKNKKIIAFLSCSERKGERENVWF
mgnify:CR=1 FL=1